MNNAVKTFELGRLFVGYDISRRGTPWVTYEGRKRRDNIFTISRVYDRESRLYIWHLMIYRMSIAFGLLPK